MLRSLALRLPFPARRKQGLYLLCLLMVLTSLFAFRSINDVDYGIHIGTGRWILQQRRVPTTDPFTWSIPSHTYVAYHWGFQVVVGFLYEHLGHLGPVLFRVCMLALTAAVLGCSLGIRRVEPVIGALCALLALVATELRFSVRPELCTYLFTALLIVSLDLWRRGRSEALFAIPFICLGWVNTHIYILAFVFLVAELVEQVATKRVDSRFVWILLLSVMATFVNPYGFEGVAEPLRLFTRMDEDNIFKRHILELYPPISLEDVFRTSFRPTVHFSAWALFLLLSIVAVVRLLKERRIADVLVVTLFGLLSLVAVRNMSLFTISALPAVAYGVTLFFRDLRRDQETILRYALSAVMVAGVVLGVRVASGAWYASHRRDLHFSADIERVSLAIDAAEFVERHNLQGRGFNNFNVGGALILGAPSHPIFIDGRNEVTGEKFFRAYLEILQPARFDTFVDEAKIEYVVLSHSNMTPLIRHLMSSGKWTLAHYDAVAVVMVRKDGQNGHLPAKPWPSPVTDEERWGFIRSMNLRPGLIDSLGRWMFGTEELPYERDRLGTFLLTIGRWAEAERPLLESVFLAPNFWETSNNLGALYTRLGMWEASTLIYRSVLMLDSSNAVARERQEMSAHKAYAGVAQ